MYIKLIGALSPRYVNKHYDLYFPFIKETLTHILNTEKE
jgi:hypothetical protein